MHVHAPLAPPGRRILCERIAKGRHGGACGLGDGDLTAYRLQVVGRYYAGDEDALVDRRSVPHSSPDRLTPRTERRIILGCGR